MIRNTNLTTRLCNTILQHRLRSFLLLAILLATWTIVGSVSAILRRDFINSLYLLLPLLLFSALVVRTLQLWRLAGMCRSAPFCSTMGPFSSCLGETQPGAGLRFQGQGLAMIAIHVHVLGISEIRFGRRLSININASSVDYNVYCFTSGRSSNHNFFIRIRSKGPWLVESYISRASSGFLRRPAHCAIESECSATILPVQIEMIVSE
jgi:hypothetical protein